LLKSQNKRGPESTLNNFSNDLEGLLKAQLGQQEAENNRLVSIIEELN